MIDARLLPAQEIADIEVVEDVIEQVDAKRPPFKSRLKTTCFGGYTMNCPSVNWQKIASDIYASPFNHISVHLQSPWIQTAPFYAFTKRVDGMLNEDWFKKLREMFYWLWYYRTGITICFADKYFADFVDSTPFPGTNPLTKIWPDDPKPYYNSWMGGNDFAWLKWPASGPDELNPAKYKPVGHGIGLEKYYDRVIKTATEVRDQLKAEFPTHAPVRLFWRGYNEGMRRERADGSVTSIGGETKIHQWIEMKFEKAGWVKDRLNFMQIDDYMAFHDNFDHDLDWMYRYRKYMPSIKGLNEKHGITHDQFLKYRARGFESKYEVYSTDGVKERDKEWHVEQVRKLIAAQEAGQIKYLDLKWTDMFGNSKSVQDKWNKTFQRHVKAFWG